MTRAQVIVEMAKIVAAVGDGHTNIYPTRDHKIGFNTLPAAFTYFGNQLYVRACPAGQEAILGGELIRIGTVSAEEACRRVRTMIGHDNDGGARYWAQYLLAMPEVLQELQIIPDVSVAEITLSIKGRKQKAVLHPYGPVDIMSGDTSTLFKHKEGWLDVRDQSGGPEPAWLAENKGIFHFEHLGSLLYVRINEVKNAEHETFAGFAGRLKTELGDTRPEKVAIDLRQNRGGDGSLITPLIRTIIQSEQIDRLQRRLPQYPEVSAPG